MHEPYNLAIPGCDAVCPLGKFVEFLKPIIPVNLEKECKMGIFSDDFTFSSLAVIGQYLVLYVKNCYSCILFFVHFCSLLLLQIPESYQPEDMPLLKTQACTVAFCCMSTFATTYQIFCDVHRFQPRSFISWIVLTFKSTYFPKKEKGFSLR